MHLDATKDWTVSLLLYKKLKNLKYSKFDGSSATK